MRECLGREYRMQLPVLLVTIVVLAVTASRAQAMHPFFTDDTGTQGPGGVLVESNVNYLKDNEFKSTVVPVVVTVGIGETMDAVVEMPYLSLHPSTATGNNESGLSDMFFRFKHRFYEQEKKSGGRDQFEQSLAYQVAFSQPTGSEEKGLGTGTARWGARLISTTEWQSIEINANLGYESSGKALRRGNFSFDDAVSLSIAAKYERPKPWEPVVELAVTRAKGPDAVTRFATVLAGMIYEPSEKFYLDGGVRAGLNERSEDYALLAGFGYKF
jgi:Putative MetA-pathway of phenol degradation